MIVNIIDWIFVIALLLPVLYLFVFAAFSMRAAGALSPGPETASFRDADPPPTKPMRSSSARRRRRWHRSIPPNCTAWR